MAKLTNDGIRSRYLDRLRDRFASLRPSVPPPRPRDDSDSDSDSLEKISRTATGALADAAAAVDLALLQLELAEQKLETAVQSGAPIEHVQRLAETFNAHRDSAMSAREELKVHRESVGIRQTRLLFKLYPVPPKR